MGFTFNIDVKSLENKHFELKNIVTTWNKLGSWDYFLITILLGWMPVFEIQKLISEVQHNCNDLNGQKWVVDLVTTGNDKQIILSERILKYFVLHKKNMSD